MASKIVDSTPLLYAGGQQTMDMKGKGDFYARKFSHHPHRGDLVPACKCGPKILFHEPYPAVEKDKATRTRKYDGRQRMLIFVKWGGPAALWVFSMFISVWLLHIGTYLYVRLMERFEHTYDVRWKPGMAPDPNNPEWLNATDYFLSPGIDKHSLVSYGSLEDPLEGYLGWTSINLHTLDMVSAAIPGTWWILTLYTRDLQLWTKAIICNSMLAIWKGLFAAMTIVPDSIGWVSCKKRLGEDNLNYLMHTVPKPSEHGYYAMMKELFHHEIWGKTKIIGGVTLPAGAGMRFCADMMYSGHTYFTTLYALCLYELVRSHTEPGSKFHIIACVIIGLLCVAEQTIEASLVVMDRFHYTMDVAMAILITFLWHSNASVIIAARNWTHWAPFAPKNEEKKHDIHTELGEKEANFKDERWYKEHFTTSSDLRIVSMAKLNHTGDVETPVCFVPFCCCPGRFHLLQDEHIMHPVDEEYAEPYPLQ